MQVVDKDKYVGVYIYVYIKYLCDAYNECCTEGSTGFRHSSRNRNMADKPGRRTRGRPRTALRYPCIQSRRRKPDMFSTRIAELVAASYETI